MEIANERTLRLLHSISEALNQSNTANDTMDVILSRLRRVLGLQSAWVFSYDASRSIFSEVGASGLPPALADNHMSALKTGACECQSRYVQGRLKSAANIVQCSRLHHATGDTRGLIYHASIPLKSKNGPLGLLNVAAPTKQEFTSEALNLLSMVGHQVSVAIDRARLITEHEQFAQKLSHLYHIMADLKNLPTIEQIAANALKKFVEDLDYEACGIHHTATPHIWVSKYVTDRPTPVASGAYRYETRRTPLLPRPERQLLGTSCDVMEEDLPGTEWRLRLETAWVKRFSDSDRQIFQVFAHQLGTALAQYVAHQNSLQLAHLEERNRLAADLHDSISQRLFSAQLLLSAARAQSPAHRDPLVTRAQSVISEAQEELRDTLAALRPQHSTSFWDQLKDHVATLNMARNTHFWLDCPTQLTEPPPQFFENLSAIVDETLQNVLRHAHADDAWITIRQTDQQTIIKILDNGCGYDPQLTSPGRGTLTRSERTNSMAGHMMIDSTPGKGTCVTIAVPTNMKDTLS